MMPASDDLQAKQTLMSKVWVLHHVKGRSLESIAAELDMELFEIIETYIEELSWRLQGG